MAPCTEKYGKKSIAYASNQSALKWLVFPILAIDKEQIKSDKGQLKKKLKTKHFFSLTNICFLRTRRHLTTRFAGGKKKSFGMGKN